MHVLLKAQDNIQYLYKLYLYSLPPTVVIIKVLLIVYKPKIQMELYLSLTYYMPITVPWFLQMSSYFQ